MIIRSVLLFLVAGLCEIGGGYLVWRRWRDGDWWLFGAAGGVGLLLYGSFRPTSRLTSVVCNAAYGGIFVVLSLLWGWRIDGVLPDRFDLAGAGLCPLGVGVIMYWPR